MNTEGKNTVRCAIYTRKSSEEGLEQSFNSLHAQREACEAYIVSQRHEGWRALDTQYDDGGFSGGSIERPALKHLLADIEGKSIDTVVVYKVDRLTRSLADFAKIVEAFDQRGVSFVSVTQQFNTTSSMGRLTLNVLLSFAQFEREVTGERIRDKIAASKRKGMWMGGRVPFGYDLEGRRLVANAEEAEGVKEIYALYLKLGCVSKLKEHLDRRGTRSKLRVSRTGRSSGGALYSRGALYELLQNRLYVGETRHKQQFFPGKHQAIITRELWDQVQAKLKANVHARKNRTNSGARSLLCGLLFDEQGNRFTPSHAVKNGKRYRYYVQNGADGLAKIRIPAREIEDLVVSRLRSFFGSAQELIEQLTVATDDVATTRALIEAGKHLAEQLTSSTATLQELLGSVCERIVLREDSVEVKGSREALIRLLLGREVRAQHPQTTAGTNEQPLLVLVMPLMLKRCGGEIRLIIPGGTSNDGRPRTVTALIKCVSRAHEWTNQIGRGEHKNQRAIAAATGLDERYIGRVLPVAFLAPEIIEAILEGGQLPELTLNRLLAGIPLLWTEQRTSLGISSL